MSRDRGGDDRSWQTTGVWEGSIEQTRHTKALLEQTYEDYMSDEPEQWGIPDGLTREQYEARQKEAGNG